MRRLPWIEPTILALVSASFLMYEYRPWEAGFNEDGGVFRYIASQASNGYIPYRDLFSQHAPIHLWMSGLLWILGNGSALVWFGLISVGILGLLLALVLAVVVGPTNAGWTGRIAGVSLLWGLVTSWQGFGLFLSSGGRPQITSTVFLLAGVLLLHRFRFIAAGFLLAAACMSWQPAVVIAAGSLMGWILFAFIDKSRAIEGGTGATSAALPLPCPGKSLLAVGIGGLILGGVAVAVLMVQGSFSSFWDQAVRFPFLYAAGHEEDEMGFVQKLLGNLVWPTVAFGLIGFLWLLGATLLETRGRKRETSRRTLAIRWSLLGWTVAYCVWLVWSFQGMGDLIPLLPPIAIFAAAFVLRLARINRLAGLVCLVGSLAISVWFSSLSRGWPPAKYQRAKCLQFSRLAGDGGLLLFGDPVLQLFTEAPLVHPYAFWEPGTEAFLEKERDGVEAFLDRLLDSKPALIVVGERAKGLVSSLAPKLDRDYTNQVPLFRRGRSMWLSRKRFAEVTGR